MQLTITIDVENPATVAHDLERFIEPFLRDAINDRTVRRSLSTRDVTVERLGREIRALRVVQQIATAAHIEAAKNRKPPIA